MRGFLLEPMEGLPSTPLGTGFSSLHKKTSFISEGALEPMEGLEPTTC